MVGHNVTADVKFLRTIGYDLYSSSDLLEEVDTASLWQYITRDSSPRNLGNILAKLNIAGWNLHNAGNDAAYTLQAMLSMSIKHLTDKQVVQAEKEAEKSKRVAE